MAGPNRNIIYGLIDPSSGELRYIGQSTRGSRQTQIYSQPGFLRKKRYVASWLKNLASQNLKPEIYIIEENIISKEKLNELEIFYIAYFKAIGCSLTNLALGGNSNSGFKMPESAKEKMRNNTIKNAKLQEARAKYFKENPHPKWHNNPNSEKYKEHLRSMSKIASEISAKKTGIKIQDQNGVIYSSIREACKILNLSDSEISKFLKGKCGPVKGYTFKRV